MFVFNIWLDPEVIAHSATNFIETIILELISGIAYELTDVVLWTPSSDGITPLSIESGTCMSIPTFSLIENVRIK